MFRRQGATGTRLFFTGLPGSTMNLVCPGTGPRLDEMEAFAAELSDTGVSWSIALRADADSALLSLAALRSDILERDFLAHLGRGHAVASRIRPARRYGAGGPRPGTRRVCRCIDATAITALSSLLARGMRLPPGPVTPLSRTSPCHDRSSNRWASSSQRRGLTSRRIMDGRPCAVRCPATENPTIVRK